MSNNNNGKTISDRNNMYRNEQVCKKLKAKHGLYFAKGKEHVKQHRLREPDKSKYEIYNAVKDEIGKSRNWRQLQTRLAEKGIGIHFKYRGQTGEVQGISFSKGGYTFKGSEIDRSFSFSKLDKCFGDAGLNTAGSNRQTVFAPVQELSQTPGKADSPLLAGLGGLFSASFSPADDTPTGETTPVSWYGKLTYRVTPYLKPKFFLLSAGIIICLVSLALNVRFIQRMQRLQDNDIKYRYILMKGKADGSSLDLLETKFSRERDNAFIRSLTDSVKGFEYRSRKQGKRWNGQGC